MIINNEKDRQRFIRELLSAELPCEVDISRRFTNLMKDFEEVYEGQDLGEHPSGMQESKE